MRSGWSRQLKKVLYVLEAQSQAPAGSTVMVLCGLNVRTNPLNDVTRTAHNYIHSGGGSSLHRWCY